MSLLQLNSFCTYIGKGLTALILVFILSTGGKAQSGFCPPNINFSSGDLTNWECWEGTADNAGNISYTATPPLPDRHEIITPSMGFVDFFGQFPVPYPGTPGAMRLGSLDYMPFIQKASYTFTIPPGVNDYNFIYYYALVYAIDGCNQAMTPRFLAEVFNVTDNEYVNCKLMVAGSNFPDVKSISLPVRGAAYAKPWAPAIVNLKGMAGKTFRVEFSTLNCNVGKHCMYAYVSVDKNCSAMLSGTALCNGNTAVTIKAPTGFETYTWYNQNYTQVMGTNPSLTLNPAPPNNTQFNLVVTPIPGLGCGDTLKAFVKRVGQDANLVVHDPVPGCLRPGADLTAPSVTQGSTPGMSYYYFTDPAGTQFINRPNKISTGGTYYIGAKTDSGCYVIKPVQVKIFPTPKIVAPDSIFGCVPFSLDLTNPVITAGSDTGLQYSYLINPVQNIFIPDPRSVTQAGTYYIRGTNGGGCAIVKEITVSMAEFKVHPFPACGFGDLTAPGVTLGSTPGFQYSYWTDSSAQVPLIRPDSILTTATYFIRATHNSGCAVTKPVLVRIYPLPVFQTTNPSPVVYPRSIDLFSTISAPSTLRYTYWFDSTARLPITYPHTIVKSGRYYIKGTSSDGCSLIKGVHVHVMAPPPASVKAPNAFSPNGDGVNDVFSIELKGTDRVEHYQIFNRWGQLVHESRFPSQPWDGRWNGQPLPVGTYYWVIRAWDGFRQEYFNANGSVTILR